MDLISKFKSIGLLTDLKYTVDNSDNLRFIRLCIARAEVYRLETLKSGDMISRSSSSNRRSSDGASTLDEEYENEKTFPHTIISLNDLPMGPLENIEFRHNDVLLKHFQNEVRT